MHDMLVKLYDLPRLTEALDAMSARGIAVRRVLAPEAPVVIDWVRTNFPASAGEVGIACSRLPPSCFIAVRDGQIQGFACHDATARNFFGPEGIAAAARGSGLGRALLLAALHAQREQGYAYAIIGGVGPADFYAKCVGAIPIPGSTPGIYAGMLRATSPAS
jgi:GNAT superfamily N-acetyltransferase